MTPSSMLLTPQPIEENCCVRLKKKVAIFRMRRAFIIRETLLKHSGGIWRRSWKLTGIVDDIRIVGEEWAGGTCRNDSLRRVCAGDVSRREKPGDALEGRVGATHSAPKRAVYLFLYDNRVRRSAGLIHIRQERQVHRKRCKRNQDFLLKLELS